MKITARIQVKCLRGKWYQRLREVWEERPIDISGIVYMERNSHVPQEIIIRQAHPWYGYTTNEEGYRKVLASLQEAGVPIDSQCFKLR